MEYSGWGQNQGLAILHIDGDSFFASCEIALRPELRGKPVVTGQERGIASSMSYEAKNRGVKRGMILSEIRKLVPDVVILPSDYETYSLFSQRMFNIVRRYTPQVEEYSIDECFADLTGLRRMHRMSYLNIASRIKRDLQSQLNMTFSIGVGSTKVLAKAGSRWNKPDGLTYISNRDRRKYLEALPVEKVWGIGPQTTGLLTKYRITNAWQFATADFEWVKSVLTKPHQELWQELNGVSVFPVEAGERKPYQSISKTKTFTPPSTDPSFVRAQLSKNVENACIKARRHHLVGETITFFLKTQEFRYHGLKIKLEYATNNPSEIMDVIAPYFETIFQPRTPYRATGAVLSDLQEAQSKQFDLFGQRQRAEVLSHVFEGVDALSAKYGKHTVFLGSSLQAVTKKAHQNQRGQESTRKSMLFRGENARKRVGLPLLGVVK